MAATNGHAVNGNGANGTSKLTAGSMYRLCLDAKPHFGASWFSVLDTATRLSLAILLFYKFLLAQPVALLRFAYGWNSLWCAYRRSAPHALLAASHSLATLQVRPGARGGADGVPADAALLALRHGADQTRRVRAARAPLAVRGRLARHAAAWRALLTALTVSASARAHRIAESCCPVQTSTGR